MFQDFSAPRAGAPGAERLAAFRAELKRRGVEGALIPRADAHQGEYVPEADARLAHMTGFTGSAGIAAVAADAAALFVDGRYTLQAAQQTDPACWEIKPLLEAPVGAWLAERAAPGAGIGFDPWLHGKAEIDLVARALEKTGGRAVALDSNPVDAIWRDQPAPPAAPIRPYPASHAGEDAAAKRARIGRAVAEAGAAAAALTLPDSIAWLLNIRGGDIPRNPVPLCFAILRADGAATLFIRPGQDADPALKAHLGPDVALAPREDFLSALAGIEGGVLLDRRTSPLALANALETAGRRIVWGEDPCILPKAIKNPAEIEGARAAHLRDGA
ncbi:MAG: aminopeptidase P family N-terminal domain-containing protein, partial [Pikeienuella sp.]